MGEGGAGDEDEGLGDLLHHAENLAGDAASGPDVEGHDRGGGHGDADRGDRRPPIVTRRA